MCNFFQNSKSIKRIAQCIVERMALSRPRIQSNKSLWTFNRSVSIVALGSCHVCFSECNLAVAQFAPVEGLSHDLVCTGSIYHVHFAWQVWHGQLSPRFKFNKLKSFSGVEIDQNHVDKRILGGKGFAVGRLKRHNFCPASALRNRCCIDTKRCSGGYTQPQALRLR